MCGSREFSRVGGGALVVEQGGLDKVFTFTIWTI